VARPLECNDIPSIKTKTKDGAHSLFHEDSRGGHLPVREKHTHEYGQTVVALTLASGGDDDTTKKQETAIIHVDLSFVPK
jgi:hypothetical protein